MIFYERASTSKEPITADIIRIGARRHLIVESVSGIFGGIIRDESPTVIQPDALFVEEQARGLGVGEKLVRRLLAEARKRNVETMRGHIESEYALDIRARIFGEEALKFFHDNPEGSKEEHPEQYAELPITFAQARASLVRARESEEDLEKRSIGFDVEVDISTFDSK